MALMDENGSNGFYMPVAPAYSNNNGNGNNSNGFGQDGWWIILLFIFLAALGNGFGGGFGGGGSQPIIMTDGASGGSVQRGFDQAALMTGIDGVQAGINSISTQLCNGFSGVTAAAYRRDPIFALTVADELIDTLSVTNPAIYRSVIRKLQK